jgi:hypothetical protein
MALALLQAFLCTLKEIISLHIHLILLRKLMAFPFCYPPTTMPFVSYRAGRTQCLLMSVKVPPSLQTNLALPQTFICSRLNALDMDLVLREIDFD